VKYDDSSEKDTPAVIRLISMLAIPESGSETEMQVGSVPTNVSKAEYVKEQTLSVPDVEQLIRLEGTTDED